MMFYRGFISGPVISFNFHANAVKVQVKLRNFWILESDKKLFLILFGT